MLLKIRDTILQKTVDGMRKEGVPYFGMRKSFFLFFFLIIKTKFCFVLFIGLTHTVGEGRWL